MSMFCYQCEQVAGGKACTGRQGVCGKSDEVALDQDGLTRALIALAVAAGASPRPASVRLMVDGLFTAVTNVNFDSASVNALTAEVEREIAAIGGKAPVNDDGPLSLWTENEDVRSLKSLILLGLRGTAAYAAHAHALGFEDDLVNAFFFEGLRAVGNPDADIDTLLPLTLKTGEINLRCMELLDRANTSAYGTPVPTEVPLSIEKGPFIVISGHDLRDLELLLKQTEGRGINIYTHGEMLPAHGYPKLKAYKHLKGNFGTAWQNQQKEFAGVPAAFLFTTNCLMPVKDSYADRVYTTGLVAYPGLVKIGEDKNFEPVIQKALELGGYKEDRPMTGINGGSTVTTGFGWGTVMGAAGQVIDAVKAGKLRHIFLVGGCDGARPGRNYYTEFVEKTPDDTIVLTLACGKFRFNDMNLGTVAGLPRLMDMGQCNDAFSAIKVAVALAEAFGCGVNDLPLTLVLSWYEQKAVAILLTLLALGVKNIRLGPTLPAFVSPTILNYLVEHYGIAPTTTAEADLKAILG
jgi:hydroxylamine reductase